MIKDPRYTKVFTVHRVIGRYEIDGKVTLIAPGPLPTEITDFLVDEQVQNMVQQKIIEDMFQEAYPDL